MSKDNRNVFIIAECMRYSMAAKESLKLVREAELERSIHGKRAKKGKLKKDWH